MSVARWRRMLGAALLDWPRFEWNLRGVSLPGISQGHWTWIANRGDTLVEGPGKGVRLPDRWTSDIHVCDVWPPLGGRLMRRALAEWPVRMRGNPEGLPDGTPEVSFVIGHRGRGRWRQLDLVLRSIAGQIGARVECVLVEQSSEPEIRDRVPSWVRTIHTPVPDDLPYCRSWALNVGARMARGRLLVLHDGDMLVPRAYARELLELKGRGYEVINLKRFIFYLDEESTERAFRIGEVDPSSDVEKVIQNAEGGGSVAVDRHAFFELGGFDESFIGWGGEDNEFWERAQIRSVWPFGYLPIVHLWHPPQEGKDDRGRATVDLLDRRSLIPPEERVQELTRREFGRPDGLSGSTQRPVR